MSFDYRQEFAKFKQEWEQQEKIMREKGMSEESISELYAFSHDQFKADRNYALHQYGFDRTDANGYPLDETLRKKSSVDQPSELDQVLDTLMQTENKSLQKGLKMLSSAELQVLMLYCEQKMDLHEISAALGQKYDATQKQFYRAKNKLKKFL